MKSFFTFIALALIPLYSHAAKFTCDCKGSNTCPLENSITVEYDAKTLFFNVTGKNWEYKGYVTSQTSRTVGITYYTLPASYTFSGGTIEVRDDAGNGREFFFGNEKYHCEVSK